MSNPNFFKEVVNNAKSVEEKLLGPDYKYYDHINTPAEIGMSSKGSLPQLGDNVSGLISYVRLLVSGTGRATKTGQPLGNSFFLKTGAKCKDIKTDKKVPRYVYINNIPQGNIPFISSGMGVNFTEFKGLIPGSISSLEVLNPFNIFSAFMTGSNPKCQPITMSTTPSPINNNKSQQTEFVAIDDIQNMSPCLFSNKINPITKKACRETFQNINENNYKNDIIMQSYITLLSLLALFILYKFLLKYK